MEVINKLQAEKLSSLVMVNLQRLPYMYTYIYIYIYTVGNIHEENNRSCIHDRICICVYI